MASGQVAVSGLQVAQPEPEVRVVVHRVDLDRSPELGLGRLEPAATEIGARQRLTHGALLGLERARLLQRDHGRVGVVTLEQPRALLKCGVSVACRVHCGSFYRSCLVVQPNRIPEPGVPLTAFRPFEGARYDCDTADAELRNLVAPPYDVVDDDELAALEAAHGCNSVRLILPRDEHADGDRYARAAAVFTRWIADGILRIDTPARFYAYRMDYGDRHTRGVIGALALPEPGSAGVLPHERTLPKAKSDRLALLREMRVNVDPIWALSLGTGLTGAADLAQPLCECLDGDGVRHQLGAIDDPDAIAAIRAAVDGNPLVLADGHHRFETACNYRDERRAAGIDDVGASAILTFVVELVDDELCIQPIHRLVDLPAGTDVRALLGDAFEIEPAGPATPDGVDDLVAQMAARGALGLVDADGLALALVRPDVRTAALADEHPAVAATDAAVVESVVVPRLPDATWHYRHDAAAVAALVDKGVASAAILCSPVSVAQTRAAALAGARMPQKTTFFWPKPRTGMVFRPLDAG